MTNRLCILVCENFQAEASAVIESEGFDDVTVAAFPAHCNPPEIGWDALSEAIRTGEDECSQICLLGGCCIAGLGDPPAGLEYCHLHEVDRCFEPFISKNVIESYLKDGAYLLTPGWLARWRCSMKEWGFDQERAREYFGESMTRLVLLDTGVDAQSSERLREFADFVGLPFETAPVGLDFFKLFLTKIVLEWRLEVERTESRVASANASRQSAEYAMAFDLIGNLTGIMTEAQAIESILDLFAMLFAPEKLIYMPVEDGKPGKAQSRSSSPFDSAAVQDRLIDFAQGSNSQYGWTVSGNGFLLRIGRQNETLGVLEVDEIAFPQYKKHYLNLALNIVGVCGLAVDNARTYQQIKQTEEVLRESEERYRMLFEESPLSLWEEDFSDVKIYIEGLRDSGVKDLRGYFEDHPEAVARCAALVKVVGVNKATLELYEAGNMEEFRDGLGVVFGEESYDVFREELIALADGETRYESEAITRTLKGDEIHVFLRWSVAPGYEETLSKALVSIMDITERKRAEEALRRHCERLEEMVDERTKELRDAHEQLVRREKLAVLGQMAGMMAHELRNPLSTISNAAYYLKMILPDAQETVREYLDVIVQTVRDSDKIISDLLDFSRTKVPDRQKVAVSELVADVMEKRSPPENIEVAIEIAQGLSPVYVDRHQMSQVLGNLVTNAYQAMIEGGTLTVSAGAEEGQVSLAVTDTGVGIPEEDMAKLFEPLFTTKAKGLGLGLMVVKSLVEANEGSIEAMSEVGKGSTFTVRLPRA